MNNELNKNIISKYLAGKASPEEVKNLEEWFYSFDDSNVEILNDLPIEKEIYKEEFFEKINERISVVEALEHKTEEIFIWKKIMPWAASILLFISLGLGIFIANNNSEKQGNQLVSTFNGAKKQKIILADGSIVHLNLKSTLRYPKQFSGMKREVFLVGEAFFEVAKNPKKPFIIHTENLTTKVLGTSFNVSAYPSDSIAVTVISGKVSVSDENNDVILLPNMQAVYAKNTKELTSTFINKAENYKEWTEGKLTFENKNIGQIATTLEKYYDINISFGNESIKNCKISTRFENEPIEKVLDLICAYINANFKKDGNKVIINGSGCGT